jgi:branched-chain amino acid transport system substrate-binding protein
MARNTLYRTTSAAVWFSLGSAAMAADTIKQTFTGHANIADNRMEKFANDYKKRFGEEIWYATAKTEIDMWAKAINVAQSADPVKVAKALQGMKFQGDTGEVWMRADDHQLFQPLYIATFTKAGKDVKYDSEGTGYGWRTDLRIEAKDTVMPTTCKMEQPQ